MEKIMGNERIERDDPLAESPQSPHQERYVSFEPKWQKVVYGCGVCGFLVHK